MQLLREKSGGQIKVRQIMEKMVATWLERWWLVERMLGRYEHFHILAEMANFLQHLNNRSFVRRMHRDNRQIDHSAISLVCIYRPNHTCGEEQRPELSLFLDWEQKKQILFT